MQQQQAQHQQQRTNFKRTNKQTKKQIMKIKKNEKKTPSSLEHCFPLDLCCVGGPPRARFNFRIQSGAAKLIPMQGSVLESVSNMILHVDLMT